MDATIIIDDSHWRRRRDRAPEAARAEPDGYTLLLVAGPPRPSPPRQRVPPPVLSAVNSSRFDRDNALVFVVMPP